jgi:transposase
VRQQKSLPLADAFEVWLRAKLALISEKIKLAGAIRYALSRWQGSTRFIDDDRIKLDNNTVERSIRGIKLRRKNPVSALARSRSDIIQPRSSMTERGALPASCSGQIRKPR